MWLISATLMYLAIHRKYEPLLLLPIGFGILIANLPLTTLMEPGAGLIWRFYHYGIEWEIIPPVIFLGLGALTDFGPLLSQPRLIFLGAAAQAGVYITFFVASSVGFTLEEAATIGIIGGGGWANNDISCGETCATSARRLCCCSLFIHGACTDYPATDHAFINNREGT